MSNQEFRLKNANSSVIQLISVEQALTELQKIDDYISNFSRFDLESRLNSSSSTVDDYFAFVARHILSWNKEYSECIGIFINYINTICIDQLQLLTLPSRILIVLTDGRDENNAAYCRNKNVIVLPRNRVQMHERNREVFIHELFHIWSKQDINMEIRDELYASIGYYRIPTETQLKFPASLSETKITNPDAPFVMKYFINLTKQKDTSDKTYKCTPILHASRLFDPAFSTNMFRYLIATTLILDDDTYEPLQPLEYLPYDQTKDFLYQIGENTHYTIHPEEILAENFVLWMISSKDPNQLKTPVIVQKMNDIIARAAASIPHLIMVASSNKTK